MTRARRPQYSTAMLGIWVWLSYTVVAILSALLGWTIACQQFTRLGPGIVQRMLDERMRKLTMHEATIEFAKQRNARAVAVVIFYGESDVFVGLASHPDSTPEDNLRFRLASVVCLQEFVQQSREKTSPQAH